MRIENLKPLTILSMGKQLRTQAALAISDVELYKQAAGKQILSDFFLDCAVQAGGTVNPILPATSVVVNNAQAVTVKNSAGATISAAATATVAGGVLTGVGLPATVAGVTSAVKINIGAGSGSGNFATFTVANGVITAVVLSAS